MCEDTKTSAPRNGWGLLNAAPREALSSYTINLPGQ